MSENLKYTFKYLNNSVNNTYSSNEMRNRFNINSYYPIDSFKYFDDYVEIISNGQKYKSYNKRIKTILNNFKLIDNKFYCNYFNQKSEAEIGIRTYNNRKFKYYTINKYSKTFTYIEQTLEVHIKNKCSAAYYLNFTEPIEVHNEYNFVNILCLNKKFYFENIFGEKRIYYEISKELFYSNFYNLLDENTRIKINNLKQIEELYCYLSENQNNYGTTLYDAGRGRPVRIKHITINEENLENYISNYLILAQITPLKE